MNKIDKVYYINLEHRHDRNNHMMNQLNYYFPIEKICRINGIKHNQGFIGCGYSHINALKNAIENNYENVIIFEDDFKFIVNKEDFNNKINYFINKFENFDICLLSYNLMRGLKINDNVVINIIEAQCASGYLINKKFMQTLLNTFTESVFGLLNGKRKEEYAIDILWKKLQGKNKNFYGFNPKIGLQIASYSDIENRIVDYKC